MSGHRTLTLHRLHPDYPIRAACMRPAPDPLIVRGTLPAAPSVAIVGTRAATEAALGFTYELAGQLARMGAVIWSGGAAGIDAAAHRGALEAGGSTVVVMGTGFDRTYPADHRTLFEQVLEGGGGWLSMFPREQLGTRWSFLRRNELLAAMADAVLVVQAPLRSGARSTAAAARRMGRTLWVVPSAPWEPSGAGCLEELRLGAELLPPLSAVAQRLGIRSPAGAPGPRELPSDLQGDERTVAMAVGNGCRHADDICRSTGLGAHQVASALLTLCLRHVLVQGADGRLHCVT
jgi:DNA processing protein